MTAEGEPRDMSSLTTLERFFGSLDDEQREVVSATIRNVGHIKEGFMRGKLMGVIEVDKIDPRDAAAIDDVAEALWSLALLPGGEFSDEQVAMMWELCGPALRSRPPLELPDVPPRYGNYEG